MDNIILKTIEENFNEIILNEKTKKIEFTKGNVILEIDYDTIKESAEKVCGIKITKKEVKDAVQYWCRDHKYTPEEKKSNIDDWASGFEMNNSGKITNTHKNIQYYIDNSPLYKGRIKYNEYARDLEIDGKKMDDSDVAKLIVDTEECLKFSSRDKVENVLSTLAINEKYVYHPVRDYLNGLVWDGIERIDNLFIDWFEADNTELNKEFARKWLLGAVKRMMIPGCKFDYMVLLKGKQGIGKSLFCERLSRGFGFAENPPIDQPKEYVPLLDGSWIVAMDERVSLSKKDQNEVKCFLSRSEDRVRLSYARRDSIHPRHCVFIGSTNDDRFLNDYSGMSERRYWIIDCKSGDKSKIYKEFTGDVVDQIWAEAYFKYVENPEVELIINPTLWNDFDKEQKQYKALIEDEAYLMLKDRIGRGWSQSEYEDEEEMTSIWREPRLWIGSNKIDCIPVRYLRYFLNDRHLTRSRNQLKLMYEELGFESKNCWYKGTKRMEQCAVRRGSTQTESLF